MRRLVNFWADRVSPSFKCYMHLPSKRCAPPRGGHKRGLRSPSTSAPHLSRIRRTRWIEHPGGRTGFYASTDFFAVKKPDNSPADPGHLLAASPKTNRISTQPEVRLAYYLALARRKACGLTLYIGRCFESRRAGPGRSFHARTRCAQSSDLALELLKTVGRA